MSRWGRSGSSNQEALVLLKRFDFVTIVLRVGCRLYWLEAIACRSVERVKKNIGHTGMAPMLNDDALGV